MLTVYSPVSIADDILPITGYVLERLSGFS